MDKMIVRVFDRSTWGTCAPYPLVRTVEISTVCPKCGGKRGTPREVPQFDNGQTHIISRWDNPCGHIDTYKEVLKEAGRKK